MERKFLDGAVVADNALGARQVRVIANSGQTDRAGDVLVASGCVLDRYRANPIVLADHDPMRPIGTAKVYVVGSRLEAVITFAPEGVSAKADEYCGLAKAGVLGAVSVGFRSVDREPISGTGGYKFTKWELLEISLVAVPCDPGSLVIQRSYLKSGRVLSASNSQLLAKIASSLTKSQGAHASAIEALQEADRQRRKALKHAATLAANAGAGNDADPVDVELSAAAERRRRFDAIRSLQRDTAAETRRRQIEILALA